MYSNKNNLTQLTSLLTQHEVEFAVVCPGSRNAPIVHNLNEIGIECIPVTDERSAGFYALGMSLKIGLKPVVVCVTSGTALLNLMPAVAEAYYQQVPLIIISADRPADKIDQLDGQTLHQPNALEPYVLKSINIPEAYTQEQFLHNNRLINEALNARYIAEDGPVHINVPLTEPLYEFTIEELYRERAISLWKPYICYDIAEELLKHIFERYHKPMIVLGQNNFSTGELTELSKRFVIINEALSGVQVISNADEVIASSKDIEALRPDCVIYAGGTIVSKRLKQFLRETSCTNIVINAKGAATDTFEHLWHIIQTTPENMIYSMEALLENEDKGAYLSKLWNTLFESKGNKEKNFVNLWNKASEKCKRRTIEYAPDFSQMFAVSKFEEKLGNTRPDTSVFYANSSAIRIGNIYAPLYNRHVFCNRGVNGIEGSLSTAAGASILLNDLTYCVIGDLSFFYDQNALWNQNLKGNLRILLLNNGGGGIFEKFEGLKGSPVRETCVMATHNTSAEGICKQCNVTYLSAKNEEEYLNALEKLTAPKSDRPVVLEVFTDSKNDMEVVNNYYKHQKDNK
ncbi:MAG: 2-succinyl-5-enolpyruvyl-6-hydroxy-3-cyclohexene-1-carboxylic-acid synthase [Paludibacteraceae bacterium]|nr:2-succinyl-5-enolpyruvyl-6-hydroxy-3-cyclohexene-1-carboxylic-acid synthase [Paludibacteraceae bacterium]